MTFQHTCNLFQLPTKTVYEQRKDWLYTRWDQMEDNLCVKINCNVNLQGECLYMKFFYF